MAGKIFINYRRKLNPSEAQLLQKSLQRHFGEDGVFLDVTGLEADDHWLHTLAAQVEASGAMVSLISEGWADVKDRNGHRRLDNPDDFVRFEIARAYQLGIPVLAAQLNGAPMPSHKGLPPDIAQMSFKQGMLLRIESFDRDADEIAAKLKELMAHAARLKEAMAIAAKAKEAMPARAPRGVAYWMAGAAAVALAAGIAAGPWLQREAGILPPIPADVTAAAKAVRDAEAEARQARKDAEAALRERNQAQAALKTAQEVLANAQAKGEAAASHAAELAAQLKSAEQKSSEAQAALKAANERAEKAETALTEADAKYAAALTERDRARAALKATQDALSAAESKGDAASIRVAELAGQFKDAERKLKSAQERADRAEAALKQRTPDTQSGELATCLRDKDKAMIERDKALEESLACSVQLRGVRADLERAEDRAKAAQNQRTQARAVYAEYRSTCPTIEQSLVSRQLSLMRTGVSSEVFSLGNRPAVEKLYRLSTPDGLPLEISGNTPSKFVSPTRLAPIQLLFQLFL